MLEIIVAQTDAQIQQVREVSSDYIRWMMAFETSLGLYDPDFYKAYGYDTGEVPLPGEFAAPDGRLLLALDDGQPAGCVGLLRITPEICEMRMLFVREAFQGRGIGKALGMALLGEGRKMGCTSMRLETTKVLTSAIRLYQSMGFVEIAPYHEYTNFLKDIVLFMGRALE